MAQRSQGHLQVNSSHARVHMEPSIHTPQIFGCLFKKGLSTSSVLPDVRGSRRLRCEGCLSWLGSKLMVRPGGKGS